MAILTDDHQGSVQLFHPASAAPVLPGGREAPVRATDAPAHPQAGPVARGGGLTRVAVVAAHSGALVGLIALVESQVGWPTALLAGAAALLLPRPVVRSRRRAAAPDAATIARRLRSDLASAIHAEDLPATVARILADELEGVQVTVDVRFGDTLERVGTAGPPGTGDELSLPVFWRYEEVGRLTLRLIRDAPLTAMELTTAREVARNAGRGFENARLVHAVRLARVDDAAVRDEERRRLGVELHDRAGPALAALKMMVSARRRSPEPAPAGLQGPELALQARGAAREIDHALHAGRSAALEDHGLASALALLAGRMSPEGRPEIVVFAPAEVDQIGGPVGEAAYAIAAEAIANVVRHAAAGTCAVRLTLAVGELRLTVTDDGPGLGDDPGAGVGMRSMRDRAREVGGWLDVGPGEERGVRVTAVLPVA